MKAPAKFFIHAWHWVICFIRLIMHGKQFMGVNVMILHVKLQITETLMAGHDLFWEEKSKTEKLGLEY